MRVLAERNHVVWVNYHGSRRPTVSGADLRAAMGRLRQVIQGPRRVAENITVVTPMVAPLPGSRSAAALNRRLLVRQIRSVLRELPKRPVQLWTFAPDVDYLAGEFGEEAFIYYCVDDFSEFTGYDREAILAAEGRLGARADLVITTSQRLFELKQFNRPSGTPGKASAHGPSDESPGYPRPAPPRRTVLVTHGVDAEHFGTAVTARIPDDLGAIPRPILGFWGLIQDWVDLELLAGIASARPDWSIVLVGELLSNAARLAALPNVHLLGRRPYSLLPAYARGFDVGMIPFQLNPLTQAVNPIKLREYLASGLPVVSSALPEVRRYSRWVRIARGALGWIAAIEGSIREDGESLREARREAMRGESWAAKVREIEGHLERSLGACAPTQ